MIEFKNVSKVYDNDTVALKDVNLKIDDGEFVFVVGASGAGKSTFLKLLMRDEVPSSGSIIVEGYNITTLAPREIPYYRRKMGVVFQDFRLIPNMTVFDNIAFAMRVIGVREKRISKRVPYVIALVGLAAKARRYPKELSGGEQQRVALARALANNAKLIIADEPTGNVDPKMSLEIVELLMRLNDAGTTVVMVTHEHNLVRRYNRRLIILENGVINYDGNANESQQVVIGNGKRASKPPEKAAIAENIRKTEPPVDEKKMNTNTAKAAPAEESIEKIVDEVLKTEEKQAVTVKTEELFKEDKQSNNEAAVPDKEQKLNGVSESNGFKVYLSEEDGIK